jgi:hypothetical protein
MANFSRKADNDLGICKDISDLESDNGIKASEQVASIDHPTYADKLPMLELDIFPKCSDKTIFGVPFETRSTI